MDLQRNDGVTTATIDLSTRDMWTNITTAMPIRRCGHLFHYRIDLARYRKQDGREL